MSNFFLCDMCSHKQNDLPNEDDSFPLPTDCMCEKQGKVEKRVMVDHGRGRGYDKPLDVCHDFNFMKVKENK